MPVDFKLDVTQEKTKPSSKREQFYLLVNSDKNPGCRLWAFENALAYFRHEKKDSYFDYTSNSFDEWLQNKYNECLKTVHKDYWLDSGELLDGRNVGPFSDRSILERFIQYAPTNLLDGVWLENILPTGPCTKVEAMLFRIRIDEGGNGQFEQNHPNLYLQLLKSKNVELPLITSQEFSEDKRFLDSAFEDPIFQMCVGLFPRYFLPELLGMTLFMEWTATPASYQIAKCLKQHNINDEYYTVHAKVDNIKNGHGFLAREAVELYLEQIQVREGKEVMQTQWQRIWRGYHTWEDITLEFEDKLQNHLVMCDSKNL